MDGITRMKPFPVTTVIKKAESIVGLPAMDWLIQERDRINQDPSRSTRIIEPVTLSGIENCQLVDDSPPEFMKEATVNRVKQLNEQFRGRWAGGGDS